MQINTGERRLERSGRSIRSRIMRHTAWLSVATVLGVGASLAAPVPPALALILSVGEETTTAAPAAVSTSPPALSGTPAPGQSLSCSQGAWSGSPNSFSYSWQRDGVTIAGQSSSTYAVQSSDRGHSVSCRVTARNEGGEYAITQLPAASFQVSFEPDTTSDYLGQEYKGKPISETGDPVPVALGGTTAGVNANLQRGGQISGKVTAAATGIPLKGIDICVAGTVLHFRTCTLSGSGGEYLVSGLPTDSYQVEFESIEAGDNYATQFYSGKTKSTEANPVQVNAGATTAGVNVALTSGGIITGTVTGGEAPLAGAEVCADGHCAITDGLGRYTINNLPSGKYSVSFVPVPESFGLGGLFDSESGEPTPPRQSPYSRRTDNGRPREADGSPATAVVKLGDGSYIAGEVVAKEGGAELPKVIVCAEEQEPGTHCTIPTSAANMRSKDFRTGATRSTSSPSSRSPSARRTTHLSLARQGTLRRTGSRSRQQTSSKPASTPSS